MSPLLAVVSWIVLIAISLYGRIDCLVFQPHGFAMKWRYKFHTPAISDNTYLFMATSNPVNFGIHGNNNASSADLPRGFILPFETSEAGSIPFDSSTEGTESRGIIPISQADFNAKNDKAFDRNNALMQRRSYTFTSLSY